MPDIIYENWNEDRTELFATEINPDVEKLAKMLRHEGKWLLVVKPVFNPMTQENGGMTFSATERSWEVVSLDQSATDKLLADYKTAKISLTNQTAMDLIYSIYPAWVQANYSDGTYPHNQTYQDDKANVIEESNRVNSQIVTAINKEDIDALYASINWPTIGGA